MELGQSEELIVIRDTQDRAGTVLAVSPGAWVTFAARFRGNA